MKALKKSREIEYRVLGKECIIFVPEKALFYKLNETGTRIWRLLNGKRGEKEIAKQIVKEFEVNAKKASQDIKKFLKSLERKGLIE